MRWLIGLALLASACSTPTGPSSPTPAPTPTPQATLTGHLTATNGGQPLAGVSVSLGSISSTTDGAGLFSSNVAPTASMRAVLEGSGILPRTVYLAATATRDVSMDAIALGGGFDATFYRELVRNANEGGNEPLRRWTTAPNVYLRTIRNDGVAVDAAMLDTAEQVIRDTIPRWSGFTPTVERGADTRAGQAGWLTVLWPGTVGADRVCGASDVGRSGGTLNLFVPTTAACGCDGSTRIRPRVIRHELGHAMGFYHTDAPTDVMIASSAACDVPITARELYHAAIAYRRPVGNQEPDNDPASAVNLAPMRAY